MLCFFTTKFRSFLVLFRVLNLFQLGGQLNFLFQLILLFCKYLLKMLILNYYHFFLLIGISSLFQLSFFSLLQFDYKKRRKNTSL